MNVIGITPAEQDNILRTVAAVLHLGNISFSDDDKGNGYVADANCIAFYSLFFNVFLITT